MKRSKEILLVFVAFSTIYVTADEVNVENLPENADEIFRNLMRPFRMEKLNLIWVKAQQVEQTWS